MRITNSTFRPVWGGALALGLFVSWSAQPAQAQSSSNAWRNIAIGAGAVTAYGVIKDNRTARDVGAVATVYSGYRYKRARDHEKAAEEARRQAWYRQRYGANWQRHYRPGR